MRLMLTCFLSISDSYVYVNKDWRKRYLNLKTAELYMPILHSRPSQSYRTTKMQHLEVIIYASGTLRLVIKKMAICLRKLSFIKNKDIE